MINYEDILYAKFINNYKEKILKIIDTYNIEHNYNLVIYFLLSEEIKGMKSFNEFIKFILKYYEYEYITEMLINEINTCFIIFKLWIAGADLPNSSPPKNLNLWKLKNNELAIIFSKAQHDKKRNSIVFKNEMKSLSYFI